MTLSFHKYQSTGNDFILIDNRNLNFPKENHQLIAHLCHRRFGIGADGLMLLQNSKDYDFEMVYFNSDGHEGSMCGNGGRSIVQFAYDQKIIGQSTKFIATDGEHTAKIGDVVSLEMMSVKEVQQGEAHFFINTGSPHHVQYVANLEHYNVVEEGRNIRHSQQYAPKGTNVNFVEKMNENTIFVRTFERGVEDETYSCGTGVTACAIASVIKGMQSPVNIKTLGGDLQVSFDVINGVCTNIYLTGPAVLVFKGEISC